MMRNVEVDFLLVRNENNTREFFFFFSAREVQNSEEACSSLNFNSQTLPYITLISEYIIMLFVEDNERDVVEYSVSRIANEMGDRVGLRFFFSSMQKSI